MREHVLFQEPQELPTPLWNITPVYPGLTALRILVEYYYNSPSQPTVFDS